MRWPGPCSAKIRSIVIVVQVCPGSRSRGCRQSQFRGQPRMPGELWVKDFRPDTAHFGTNHGTWGFNPV